MNKRRRWKAKAKRKQERWLDAETHKATAAFDKMVAAAGAKVLHERREVMQRLAAAGD